MLFREVRSGVEVSVLGPLRITCDGEEVDPGPARQQAVLLSLLLRANTSVSAERILYEAWGPGKPSSGTRVVPTYIYRIRRLLSSMGRAEGAAQVTSGREGYTLVMSEHRTDVLSLGKLQEETEGLVNKGYAEQASAFLRCALEQWSEEPLKGVPGPLAHSTRLYLREKRDSLVEQKMRIDLELGRYSEVIPTALSMLPLTPPKESLAALLMIALHRAGRTAEALQVFASERRRLVEELGVEPGDRLRRAQREVLRDR